MPVGTDGRGKELCSRTVIESDGREGWMDARTGVALEQ